MRYRGEIEILERYVIDFADDEIRSGESPEDAAERLYATRRNVTDPNESSVWSVFVKHLGEGDPVEPEPS